MERPSGRTMPSVGDTTPFPRIARGSGQGQRRQRSSLSTSSQTCSGSGRTKAVPFLGMAMAGRPSTAPQLQQRPRQSRRLPCNTSSLLRANLHHDMVSPPPPSPLHPRDQHIRNHHSAAAANLHLTRTSQELTPLLAARNRRPPPRPRTSLSFRTARTNIAVRRVFGQVGCRSVAPPAPAAPRLAGGTVRGRNLGYAELGWGLAQPRPIQPHLRRFQCRQRGQRRVLGLASGSTAQVQILPYQPPPLEQRMGAPPGLGFRLGDRGPL